MLIRTVKKLVKSLFNPNPTFVEMVEAFNRTGTVDHKFEATAAAFAAMCGPEGAGTCFGCGKPGHLKRNCLTTNASTRPQAPGICPRCRKGRHYGNQCQSRYDFQGQPIQGNRSRSAGQRCAQTQVSQPTAPVQAPPQTFQPPQREATVPQVFAQQQQAVPDWTWQPLTQ